MQVFLTRVLRAAPHELPALGWAFAYFFLLLCSYYILRPVRDAFAVEAGSRVVQWLITATFIAMLALVPAFGWLCARLPRTRLLPAVYVFFAANLVAFCFFAAAPSPIAAGAFFVWLSVFNLFAVSVFWSFMSDIFDTAQAARLYGTIAAGGSCGAIAGPLIARSMAAPLGIEGLLLVSAALLLATTACIAMLARWARSHPRPGEAADEPIGGSILAGLRAALGSRFLLAICGYLLCYTVLSTALYFQQLDIVRDAVPDPIERTRLFATVDLAVNSLTLLLQILAFARLSAALGPVWMLALMPLVSLAGFLWLGATPTLAALIAFGIARRVGEFAISKPAREALFTVVPREDRYKAKNFIDTVIYRGGDALSGWALGGLSAIAFVAAGISAGWIAIAIYLGARMKPWIREDASSSGQPRQSPRALP
jgi:AAA family ATP:ADP antiporter